MEESQSKITFSVLPSSFLVLPLSRGSFRISEGEKCVTLLAFFLLLFLYFSKPVGIPLPPTVLQSGYFKTFAYQGWGPLLLLLFSPFLCLLIIGYLSHTHGCCSR